MSAAIKGGACLRGPGDTLIHWRTHADRSITFRSTDKGSYWIPDCGYTRRGMDYTGSCDRHEVTCLVCLAYIPKGERQ